MMKTKLKSGLILLVAVLALSAMGVSSASAALPELVNKNGTELTFGFFTTSSSPSVEFEGSKVQKNWACTGSKAVGLVTGPKTSKINITYTGCNYKQSGTCKSPGQPEGTIKPNPLLGKLVYLNAEHTKVGWALEPATKNGVFVEITCTAINTPWKVGVHEAEKGGLDSLLAEIQGPYNVKTTELTPELECTSGIQRWQSYSESGKTIAGYLEDETLTLQGKIWEDFCLRSAGPKLQFEEEVELKA